MSVSPEVKKLRKEAEEWLEENGHSGLFTPFPNRSCWKCNPAHEHLKEADYPIACFVCGHTYFKGVKLIEEKEEQ